MTWRTQTNSINTNLKWGQEVGEGGVTEWTVVSIPVCHVSSTILVHTVLPLFHSTSRSGRGSVYSPEEFALYIFAGDIGVPTVRGGRGNALTILQCLVPDLYMGTFAETGNQWKTVLSCGWAFSPLGPSHHSNGWACSDAVCKLVTYCMC